MRMRQPPVKKMDNYIVKRNLQKSRAYEITVIPDHKHAKRQKHTVKNDSLTLKH